MYVMIWLDSTLDQTHPVSATEPNWRGFLGDAGKLTVYFLLQTYQLSLQQSSPVAQELSFCATAGPLSVSTLYHLWKAAKELVCEDCSLIAWKIWNLNWSLITSNFSDNIMLKCREMCMYPTLLNKPASPPLPASILHDVSEKQPT